MNSNDKALANDSTIYNYKLVKRLNHSYLYTMFFALLFLLALIANLLEDRALHYMLCFPAILVLQILIAKLYLRTARYGFKNEWKLHYGMLWLGLIPTSYASVNVVRKVQVHVLIGGLFIIGILYPWLSTMNLLNLLFAHFWIILPRLVVILRFRKYDKNGLFKISRRDTSCYLA
ncbi:hypothetical protein E0485_23285 [Paenibacillus albiflavus]|uniref:Permease n=1 Tax=Paenibacillus albiflavus TaxID=2545760 RepID=A0A4R4DYM1_9BACL|nr:hypothetical protein [Paenibacillus albiflavus]TCZ70558.1 hypothetical protein E0485_23285 [Paenibacillus albiflavus]